MIKHNMVGKTFGRWTVVTEAGTNARKDALYWCKCECGTERKVIGSDLRKGRSTSCGCQKGITLANKTYRYVDRRNNVLLGYKHGAEQRGHTFELSDEYFFSLVTKPCTYCGDSNTSHTIKSANGNVFYYTGIDRVDNSKGYTVDNSVPCCSKCNYMKRGYSVTDFINHINKIHSYNVKE